MKFIQGIYIDQKANLLGLAPLVIKQGIELVQFVELMNILRNYANLLGQVHILHFMIEKMDIIGLKTIICNQH